VPRETHYFWSFQSPSVMINECSATKRKFLKLNFTSHGLLYIVNVSRMRRMSALHKSDACFPSSVGLYINHSCITIDNLTDGEGSLHQTPYYEMYVTMKEHLKEKLLKESLKGRKTPQDSQRSVCFSTHKSTNPSRSSRGHVKQNLIICLLYG